VYILKDGKSDFRFNILLIALLVIGLFCVTDIYANEASRSIETLKGGNDTGSSSGNTSEIPESKLIESNRNIKDDARMPNPEQQLPPDHKNTDRSDNAPIRTGDKQDEQKISGDTVENESSWKHGLERYPEKASESLPADGNQNETLLPAVSDKTTRDMDSWSPDETRGKPRINLALTFFSLLAVAGIAYITLRAYSKFLTGDKASPLFRKKLVQIRERHALAPNKMLCVVELPDRIVLLGVSDNEINLITEIDPVKAEEYEYQPKQEAIEQPSASSYLTDVIFRKWQGSK
jgi:flagellar biogenesis protein FliO